MAPNSVLFRSAISILLMFALTGPCLAAAGGVGTVTHLSGPLFGRKADGASRTLSINSAVEQGDTLVSEKRTYGRVKFTDGGEVTLRPGTSFVVESYFFDKDKPSEDKAVFGLVKGSLRAVTGQVSKRGNQDAYKMKTATATIGVRGTSYDLKVCEDNCPGLQNGIYFFVVEGMVEVSNVAGAKTFGAGQYGYVKDDQSLPVLLPFVPNLGMELPPFENEACGVR
jgi:hypothetical protein